MSSAPTLSLAAFGSGAAPAAPAAAPVAAPAAAPAAALPDGFTSDPAAAPTQYTTVTADHAAQAAATAAEPKQSLFGLWKSELHSDLDVFTRTAAASGFEPDTNYRLPQYGTPGWKQLTQGIPEQYWGQFQNAVSADHAQFIRQNILDDMHQDQLASQHSLGARLAVGALDPANVALLAVPGVGEEVDAGRVAKFLIDGTQMSAENAAQQALMDNGRYTVSGHDVADAAVQGFLLHSAAHTLGEAGSAALEHAGLRARRAIGVNQIADLLDQGKLTPEQVRPEVLKEIKDGTPDGFGPDTASAANATLAVAPPSELHPENRGKPTGRMAAIGRAVGSVPGLRTFATVLRGDRNSVVRDNLGRLVSETVGAEDGSSNTIGADAHALAVKQAADAAIGSISQAHKPAFMQERGYSGFFQRYSRTAHEEWSKAIAQEVRGIDSGSDAAKLAAPKVAAIYNHLRHLAKNAGVDGFDSIEQNPNYLPRVFDNRVIRRVNQAIGDQGMVKFLSDSISSKSPEIDPEVSEAIAKGYLARTKRLGAHVDQNMMNGVRLDDVEYIRDMLKEAPDVDPSQVDGVINMLKRDMEKRGSGEPNLRNAKQRVQFDETHAIDVPGMGTVHIADLFSNDALGLTERYANTLAGHIGLARVGIKSDNDFARALDDARSSMYEDGRTSKERDLVESYAVAAHKLLLGRALDDGSYRTARQAAQAFKNYAFSRTMGRGLFSVADSLIRPWTNGYSKYAMKYVSSLGHIFRDGDGEQTHPLSREIEQWTGMGGDDVSMGIYHHYVDEDRTDRAVGAASHAMSVAGHLTSKFGGMTLGLKMGKRLMANAIVDRIVRNAFGEADLPESRLAMMGLDKPMLDRIAGQIRQHAPEVEGNGGPIRSVNWSSWDDLDARDAMLTGVSREAGTLIHSEDMSATAPWMHTTIGRLIIQLRRFPMMAMTKQLARGLHDHDLGVLQDFMLNGSVGAASMWAQAHLMSVGMSNGEKQQFLKENTDPGRLMAAFLQRNVYSGMVPQILDLAAQYTTGHPIFNARASGVGGGVAIPAVEALQNLGTAITNPLHQSALTQREARALVGILPLGNSLPAVWASNALSSDLPKTQPRTPGSHKGPWL